MWWSVWRSLPAPGPALCPPSHCRLVESLLVSLTYENQRVCSAMEGRGRDPGQRALLLLLLLLLEGAAEARLAQRPREQTVRV